MKAIICDCGYSGEPKYADADGDGVSDKNPAIRIVNLLPGGAYCPICCRAFGQVRQESDEGETNGHNIYKFLIE